MIIYLDFLLVINFIFDYLILLTISKILKKNIKKFRIFLGSIVGEISLVVLFLNLNPLFLFLLKLIFSILIIVITFGKKNIIENVIYFFSISILLGGFLYYLKTKVNVFYLLLVIISPMILYIYIGQIKKIKTYYSLKHRVDIYLDNGKTYYYNGLLDTGNMLRDPYKNRPIIIVFDRKIEKEIDLEQIIYVPFNSVEKTGVLKCFKPKRVYIEDIGLKNNILIGIGEKTKCFNDTNCIFGNSLVEEK